jgi:arsenite methyltransferase
MPLSQLVGEAGKVVGVDMTEEQLAVAEAHRAHHRQAFGHARDNVEFKLGYIERLDQLGLE